MPKIQHLLTLNVDKSVKSLGSALSEVPSSSLFKHRDGRVSENTVCLIRKLLVLDPQNRLTAGEVLESLSAIIASW